MTLHPLFAQIIAVFAAPLHQKTARQVQAVKEDKILVEDWIFEMGMFVAHLYKKSWGDRCICHRAAYPSCMFQEWCKDNYSYEYWPIWWAKLREVGQRGVVEAFIRSNESALSKQMDNYKKSSTTDTGLDTKTGR
ncbi:hypothetical protein F0L74_09920 [Chitinophaga agrisoli]|uniref:Uncharacterized protein n=1 Tax=Chitinophaga agrisoli TaxID=2607653 RepID=A0A5B2VXA7_9BACT|nr:hypothetical protein [Chitinophaga agrisoli]KAA2242836.1 hypothetical protein F0L74_09920 [Chitinophaga agrisoli]